MRIRFSTLCMFSIYPRAPGIYRTIKETSRFILKYIRITQEMEDNVTFRVGVNFEDPISVYNRYLNVTCLNRVLLFRDFMRLVIAPDSTSDNAFMKTICYGVWGSLREFSKGTLVCGDLRQAHRRGHSIVLCRAAKLL